MPRNMRFFFSLTAITASLLAATSSSAQEERLELDWVFSEEGKAAMSLPRYTWIDSGVVALYDTRRPKAERTIETVRVGNETLVLVTRWQAVPSCDEAHSH